MVRVLNVPDEPFMNEPYCYICGVHYCGNEFCAPRIPPCNHVPCPDCGIECDPVE